MRSENQPLLGVKKKNRPGSVQASSPPLNVPNAGGGQFIPIVPDPSLLQSPSQQQQQSPYPHPRRSSVGNVLDFSHGPAPGALMHRASFGGGGAAPSFLGAMSLPASPPFEAGPVMHFADGDQGDDGHADRGGSGRGSEMLHASPLSTFGHARTHSNQGDDVGLLSSSLHRSTTVGPGSYIPASAHHMMEMMTTPGRGGGAGGGLGSVAEDGGGDNGGGNNGNSSNSLNKGRPEPHIEEAMFDLDPDFDLSAPHLMKMFNMLDRDHNGEGEGAREGEGGREGACLCRIEGVKCVSLLTINRQKAKHTHTPLTHPTPFLPLKKQAD